MKKTFVLMVALAWATILIAETATTADGYTYTYRVLDGESVEIYNNGSCAIKPRPGALLTIPSVLDGKKVTSIGENAFSLCEGMTSVTIPESVRNIGSDAFYHCTSLMSVTIPKSVVNIGNHAFYYCTGLTSVTINEGVVNIGNHAFYYCTSLMTVMMPESVVDIGKDAFYCCDRLTKVYVDSLSTKHITSLMIASGLDISGIAFVGRFEIQDSVLIECVCHLTNVVIPEGVTRIGSKAFRYCSSMESITIPDSVALLDADAFSGCSNLKRVVFMGDAPYIVGEGECVEEEELQLFFGTPRRLEVCVSHGSIGWNGGISSDLPTTWNGRVIEFSDETYDWNKRKIVNDQVVSIVSTNVVVHYIVNSVQPAFVNPPTNSVGFVNIISEVKGGCVAVPESWAEEYPAFYQTFKTKSFTEALTKLTGKRDGVGNPMFVWQDYVAGTDPTKKEDVFTASITIDKNGRVQISYSPELDDVRKALRKYTTWGKKSLMDTAWTEVERGCEAEYNFFKVTVEMR